MKRLLFGLMATLSLSTTPLLAETQGVTDTSVKLGSSFADWSHPGLKVRMFFSNIPWKRPITVSPFLRMIQFFAFPPSVLKPSVS